MRWVRMAAVVDLSLPTSHRPQLSTTNNTQPIPPNHCIQELARLKLYSSRPTISALGTSSGKISDKLVRSIDAPSKGQGKSRCLLLDRAERGLGRLVMWARQLVSTCQPQTVMKQLHLEMNPRVLGQGPRMIPRNIMHC